MTGALLFAMLLSAFPDFTGLADHQILQRDAGNAATVSLHGAAPVGWDGAVLVTALPGLDRQTVGRVEGGQWQCNFQLPAGGPYDVQLSMRNGAGQELARRDVRDVLVGDIWVLAGQSNMLGRGDLVDVETPSPMVRAFDMTERWTPAEEPLHRFWEARDPIYRRQTRVETAGAGLGLTFAKAMAAADHTPIGLVPCALGGSSISLWDPALQSDASRSLYGAMLRRLRLAGGKARGILWYQGEADARDSKMAGVYGEKLQALIAAVRKDSGKADLGFYLVQLGRMLDWPYYGVNGHATPPDLDQQYAQVREAQRQVGLKTAHAGTVASIDLELRDGIHLATPDLKRVGRRLANRTRGVHGPQLERVTHDRGAQRIAVRFSGVTGGFDTKARIAGFSLRSATGAEIAAIYSAAVDPSHAGTVVLSYQGELPSDARLYYGRGANPYCNLVDGADMAVPCFGPVKLDYPSE